MEPIERPVDYERRLEFEARLDRCSAEVQEIVKLLCIVADHAGFGVQLPTYEVRGVGITYWYQSRRFCRFDPKENSEHVWVLIPGGDRAQLEPAGEVSDRDDGPWVCVSSMVQAVRLVPAITEAFDRLSEPNGPSLTKPRQSRRARHRQSV